MANIKSAIKRARQNIGRRARNRSLRSFYRSSLKNFQEVVASGDAAKASEMLSGMYKIVDKAVTKGIIKKNKASRTKSNLTLSINKLKNKSA